MKYIDSYAVFENKHNANIKEELESGYCEFYYRKQDGSKRHAWGTLKHEFLKKVWKPSKDTSKVSDGFIVYWDIKRKNFRQFHKDLFIGLEMKWDTLNEFIEANPKLKKRVEKAKETLIESENEKKKELEDEEK